LSKDDKKQMLKHQINVAAKAVFKEYGYEGTTISMISKKASIGRGTIYNYYKSKAHLFVSIILDDRNSFRFDEEEIARRINQTEDPLETLQELLVTSIINYRDLSKKIWGDIIIASIGNSSDREYLRANLLSFFRSIMNSFVKVFAGFQCHQMMPEGFDCYEGARCIYNIAVSETANYLFFEDISYETYIENLRDSVRFSFVDKFIEKG